MIKKFSLGFVCILICGVVLAAVADRKWKPEGKEASAAVRSVQRAAFEQDVAETLRATRRIAGSVGAASIASPAVDELNGVYDYWGISSERFIVIDSNVIYSKGERDFYVVKHEGGNSYTLLSYVEGEYLQTFDYEITQSDLGLLFTSEADQVEVTRLR